MATTVAPVSSAPASTPAAVQVPVVTPVPSHEAPAESFGSKLDSIIKNAPMPVEDASNDAVIPNGGVSGPETKQATPETVPTPETAAPVGEAIAPAGEVKVDGDEIVMTSERNPDGTFKTQIDPKQKFEIKIRDKETGETKVYSKTVPEMLRMAADGVWGQKVRGEVQYYRENVGKWQESHNTLTTTTAQLRKELDAQMQLNRELLTAPEDLVVQRRNEFAQEMSPEKQLARLKQELAQQQERQTQTVQEQQQARQVTDFANARLAPHLAAAEAKIGPELVKMKLALDLVPFQVNGRVPPDRLNALEAHLSGPFTQWVNAKAAELSAPNPALKAAEEAARAAQVSAQRAVNATGRQIAPVGNVGPQSGADPATRHAPPKNVNDAIERIINRPVGA